MRHHTPHLFANFLTISLLLYHNLPLHFYPMDLHNKTLLIISPHPDDEILGCGGFIKKIKDNGGKVYVLFLTIGDTIEFTAHEAYSTQEQRLLEIQQVATFLKYDGWTVAFPGNQHHLRLDVMPQADIITAIENGPQVSIEQIHPDIVATTQLSDYNQDHRAACMATITACRPSPYNAKGKIRAVLGYEFTATVGSGFEPHLERNFFVQLSEDDIETKITAMTLYGSQVREKTHTRSLENMRNLAMLRGTMCGANFAEGFHCYRLAV